MNIGTNTGASSAHFADALEISRFTVAANPSRIRPPLKIQLPWRQQKSDETGWRSNQQRKDNDSE
jgi:hypothetical protein